MKKSVNLDLLEFHVREAAQELDLLLDAGYCAICPVVS